MRVLHIISSPRHDGVSVTTANALIESLQERRTDIDLDVMDLWREELPEFDERAIQAKYKRVAGEPLDEAESRAWETIESLAHRLREADRIVLGVPMWNWSIPYKLKQLIDLAAQRNLLFTYDGVHFGPAVDVARADVIAVRVSTTVRTAPRQAPSSTIRSPTWSSSSARSACTTCERSSSTGPGTRPRPKPSRTASNAHAVSRQRIRGASDKGSGWEVGNRSSASPAT